MMDAHEVIKGIEIFLENVLPKAKSSKDWSEENIAHAFRWAEFCEKVYHTFKDTPLKTKFDELIHYMKGSQIRWSICFEDLKNSSSLLFQTLNDNPHIDNEKLKSFYVDLKGEEIFKKDIFTKHELDNLCFELLEALKPIKLVNSERSLYHEVKAEIYLNLLKDSFHLATQEEKEKYLTNALEELYQNTNEHTLLLHVLGLKISEDKSAMEIQDFAINWIVLKILAGVTSTFGQTFWKRTSFLRAISLNSVNFLNVYLDYVTNCAKSLCCELEGGEMRWVTKSFNSNQMMHDQILCHFRSLLKEDDTVSECTKIYLLNLLENYPSVQIYKEIFACVT